MQCFGGCFAADEELRDPLGSSASKASNVLIKKHGATVRPRAGCKSHPCCARGHSCRCCRKGAAADKPTLRPKLHLLSSKTSKAEDFGQTYTADTDSTAADRERLRQEYLMQNGRHILGISTLQQEQLRHFVMPGKPHTAQHQHCSAHSQAGAHAGLLVLGQGYRLTVHCTAGPPHTMPALLPCCCLAALKRPQGPGPAIICMLYCAMQHALCRATCVVALPAWHPDIRQ